MDQIRIILCNKFDVICLSETWLNNNVPDNDVNLDEYTLYRRDRGSRGGGVCAYIHTSLPSRRREDLEPRNDDVLWVGIMLVPRPMLISIVYLEWLVKLQNNLLKILKKA